MRETAAGGRNLSPRRRGPLPPALFMVVPQHARRRQGTHHFPARAGLLIWFPASDPDARLGRWSV